MKRDIAIVIDPLSKLNAASDTSLEFARSFLKQKARVFLVESQQIYWQIDQVCLPSFEIESFNEQGAPILRSQEASLKRIKEFDLCMIRKDPPFDSTYQKLCWLLQPFEKKVAFFNRPSALLLNHEKMLPLQALALGLLKNSDVIPTLLPSSVSKTLPGGPQDQDFVLKPFLGYQGNEVRRADRSQVLKSLGEDLIVQPFLPEIQTLGDLRAFFFRGKYLGSFQRLPQKGSILSNLAAGGSALQPKLSAQEKKLIAKMEKVLTHFQIEFAGTDFIGGKLNEVNVTSPTGLVAHRKLFGVSLADKITSAILRKPRWKS